MWRMQKNFGKNNKNKNVFINNVNMKWKSKNEKKTFNIYIPNKKTPLALINVSHIFTDSILFKIIQLLSIFY
jgi:hypothetical protein